MAGFIGASLATLREECPIAYGQLCALLAPREVLLLFEGEAVALAFAADAAELLPQPRNPAVQLRSTRQAILDVIDARLTLGEAVLEDAILLQGAVEDLALFYEGMLTYVRGAVRSPSFPALLAHFRQVSSELLHRDDQADAG